MITVRKHNRQSVEQRRAELSESLVTAHQSLLRANAAVAWMFGCSDATYGIAWDVAPILQTATEMLHNLVVVHDLRRYHPFWSHPLTERVALTHGGFPGLSLSEDLEAAETALTVAGAQAEDLARADRTYSVYGAIGWDLETAVDDVTLAVRAAKDAERKVWSSYWETTPSWAAQS